MSKDYETFYKTLLAKSEEAYLMALEIANKPTINYRTEGFTFFICNAWELLLKAFIVRDKQDITSIFFKDKTYRTLSLSDCIDKVFTSTTDKVKLNLCHVVSIRNRSTHSVLPEYDYKFAPLFQQNVTYFNRFFVKQFPNHNFNDSITPFIAINKSPIEKESPLSIIEDSKKFMDEIVNELNTEGIAQHINFRITKKASEADMQMKLTPDAQEGVKIMKVGKDINYLFPYTFTEAVKIIQETLEITLGPNHGFSTRSFHLISADYPIKTDEQFCYTVEYGGGVKKYSQMTIDFILDRYCKDLAFQNKYKKKGS